MVLITTRAPKPKHFGKHKIITVILALVIIGGIGSAMNGGSKSAPTQASSPSSASTSSPTTTPTPEPAKNKPTMTMAEFTQLKDGMSYEDATKIIGGPGEVMSESGSKGDADHTVMYTYKGEGSIGANANLMFQGNQLKNKAQMGLK